MHDIRLIREKPAAFDAALERRGHAAAAARLLELDAERRSTATTVQALQGKRNELSKQIGFKRIQSAGVGIDNAIRDVVGSPKKDEQAVRRAASALEAEAAALQTEVALIKNEIVDLEGKDRDLTLALHDALAVLPNLPADDVPEGEDETANVELKTWGDKRQFNYPPANHADL